MSKLVKSNKYVVAGVALIVLLAVVLTAYTAVDDTARAVNIEMYTTVGAVSRGHVAIVGLPAALYFVISGVIAFGFLALLLLIRWIVYKIRRKRQEEYISKNRIFIKEDL